VNVLDVLDLGANRSSNCHCADVDSSKPTMTTEKSLSQRIGEL
jgi:hypothetical protein